MHLSQALGSLSQALGLFCGGSVELQGGSAEICRGSAVWLLYCEIYDKNLNRALDNVSDFLCQSQEERNRGKIERRNLAENVYFCSRIVLLLWR